MHTHASLNVVFIIIIIIIVVVIVIIVVVVIIIHPQRKEYNQKSIYLTRR